MLIVNVHQKIKVLGLVPFLRSLSKWINNSIRVDSEKVTYGGSLPQGLLFLENWHFWNFETCMFSKSMDFWILNIFFKNGSPEQTTMLMRRAAKFCVEPRSPFPEIFHQESKTLGTPLNIVSWPECQPEFPSDGGGGDGGDVPRTLPIWSSPWAITPRDQISREGNPSLRPIGPQRRQKWGISC